MPTYVDESGDTGSHPQSSPHFRMAAVWFETVEEADEFERQSVALRARMHLRADFEFHFTTVPPDFRRTFLEFAVAFPFRYAFVTCSKGTARQSMPKELLVGETVRGLTTTLHEIYQIAEACKPQQSADDLMPLNELVRFDESNDRLYSTIVREEFRALPSLVRHGASLIRKVLPFRSRADTRLQLADVVCGAVGRSLDGEGEYRRLIRGRELAVVELIWNGEGVVPVGTTPS